MSFADHGFVDIGRVIYGHECEPALKRIRSTRPWGPELFLEEAKFRENPVMKGVNPRPGRNILERIDTSFVEDNYSIKEYLRAILGPVTIILDKKAVAAIPAVWIPKWVRKEIEAKPVPNLGAFIKPEYRDVTYFHGIDWHQDIIDYPGRHADFVTLYVYLDNVGPCDSPLYVLPKSHELGATVFPHVLYKIGDTMWGYNAPDGKMELEQRILVGAPGSSYLWHSCTLHGTQPSVLEAKDNRISLRYIIAKPSINGYLLDEVNNKIRGRLSLTATRVDLDQQGHGIIKGNQINEA